MESTDWTPTNESRWIRKKYPLREYVPSAIEWHDQMSCLVLQKKWTRKVMHEETDPTSIYCGMCLTETEEEWRDIPIVEEA